MADLHTKVCDECGAIKRESNHWFVALLSDRGVFAIARSAAELLYLGLDGLAGQALDLCSEKCVLQATSKAISKPKGETSN